MEDFGPEVAAVDDMIDERLGELVYTWVRGH